MHDVLHDNLVSDTHVLQFLAVGIRTGSGANPARSLAISVLYFCRVSFEASHEVTGAAVMPIIANNNSVLIVQYR